MNPLVVSDIPVSFTERLMLAYQLGNISRHRMLAAIDQEGMDFDTFDKIELITFLDNLRTSDVIEEDAVLCRCLNSGYISLDPYMEDVESEMVFDVYCDECYDADLDEI